MSGQDSGTVTITANPESGEVTATPPTADPPPPTQASWDRIWLIIIGCFALICLLLVASVIIEFVRSEGKVVDTATLKELFLFSGGFLTGVLARHLGH